MGVTGIAAAVLLLRESAGRVPAAPCVELLKGCGGAARSELLTGLEAGAKFLNLSWRWAFGQYVL